LNGIIWLENTSLAAPGALAQRLQRLTVCKTHQAAPKWPTGKFFDPRKGSDGEEKQDLSRKCSAWKDFWF